jgi:hypothetical protein
MTTRTAKSYCRCDIVVVVVLGAVDREGDPTGWSTVLVTTLSS